MMKKFTLFVFGVFLFQPVIAQDEELLVEYRDEVQYFIDCMKKKDLVALNELISYPLTRAYPIPSIKDFAELRTRFSEVFDDSLITLITTSDVKKDWSQMGWRGIMLGSGTLWLQDDGTLQSVNYQSKVEAEMERGLVEEDRNAVHESLKEFTRPGLIMETKKFRVRIDEMADGTYRYASWPINSKMSDKPDLILKNGVLDFQGSGGNHDYTFTNKEYKYVCDIIVLGKDDSPPARLIVLKEKKEILNQEASIIRP